MNWTWTILFWLSAGLLVYTQLGYLAIAVLAAVFRKRKSPVSGESLPSVTLIIPAHNEEQVLADKLRNSLEIRYSGPPLEIIVANDGSEDRTVEIAEQFADQGVRLLDFSERRGKASLLNDAVSAAGGDVLCMCDANVMFHSDALQKMVAGLSDPAVGAVSGDVRLASDESNFGEGEAFYYRIERALQNAESKIGSMMGVDGGMYVVRRELFQPLAPDTILDDFTMTMNVIRQGKRVIYEPEAVATENGTPTALMEFKRRTRVTSGAIQVLKRRLWPPLSRPVELWQFVSHKLFRWIEPIFLILLFVASAALWRDGILYQIAFGLQLAFYLLGLAGTFWLKLRETRIGGIIFYFLMSHAAMAVGIGKGLFNRQPAAWTRTERTHSSNKTRAAV